MEKIYTSTRNKALARTPKEAVVKGIAEDGGLFVYDALDTLRLPLQDMMQMTYEQMAETVLQLLLPDFTEEEVKDCVENAYKGKFRDEHITPLHKAGNTNILELFHGPTCAFKDVGLRMLPQLMSKSLQQHPDEHVMILTATSGDTGKAALEGFLDVPRTGITVFYPDEGVSNIQRLQMITTKGSNTCVCAIRGNFDDAQSNVKRIFQNAQLSARLKEKGITLSSANSINIGRLIPQVVYYVYAYKEMVRTKEITFGEKVNFCVPTGNYGNVLAGYYAKLMCLPVNKFIVASNSNNVLFDFLKDGVYDRNRPFYKTISPSMDILISSNLERLLYYKSGKDADYIAQRMNELEASGRYQVREDIFTSVREDFAGGYCDDAACAQSMREFYEQSGYVMDPHTAIAYKVMKDYEKEDSMHKCVLLSTASPYKFAPAVYEALFNETIQDEFACMEMLQQKSGSAMPKPLAELAKMDILHSHLIDKDDMPSFVETIGEEIFHG